MNTMPPIPNLLVLRSPDIHRAVRFYTTLGLEFGLERHGKGPEHYCAVVNGFAFEIYPLDPAVSETAPIRIGFRVDSVDRLVPLIQNEGATLVKAPYDSEWGRRAIVKDLDNNTVELITPLNYSVDSGTSKSNH